MDWGLESPTSTTKQENRTKAPGSPLRQPHRQHDKRAKKEQRKEDDSLIFNYESDGDEETAFLSRERAVAFSAPSHSSPLLRTQERWKTRPETKKRTDKKHEEKQRRDSGAKARQVEWVDDMAKARRLTLAFEFNFDERLATTKKQVDSDIEQLLQGILFPPHPNARAAAAHMRSFPQINQPTERNSEQGVRRKQAKGHQRKPGALESDCRAHPCNGS